VEELRRIITQAGFRPEQRDTLYRSYVLQPPATRELTAA
jgi:2-iminoacetate synthase ThiH